METKFKVHVVKYRWIWMVLSAILLLPGIIAMIYASINNVNHLPLKVGIDYTGGTVLQYAIDKKVANDVLGNIRGNLEKNGISSPFLQIINTNSAESSKTQDIIAVRTKFIAEDDFTTVDKVSSVIKSSYPNAELVSTNSIGPNLGKELFKNSLVALTLACLGIVVYLSFRFKLDFALAAIFALIHDVLFVVGTFAILGVAFNVQIDALFITALLTVIGFSVHDTIVVFDRIRENLRYYAKKMSFGEIVDASVSQTMARSINTSLTTLITLLALYFLGGVTTKDFVLAMILGILIGTYSSIFFASMLVDFWEEHKAKKKHA
ncbi:MAG: protein translocase subunit SecF [Candidatus Gastranaerophilaceae bacterium]